MCLIKALILDKKFRDKVFINVWVIFLYIYPRLFKNNVYSFDMINLDWIYSRERVEARINGRKEYIKNNLYMGISEEERDVLKRTGRKYKPKNFEKFSKYSQKVDLKRIVNAEDVKYGDLQSILWGLNERLKKRDYTLEDLNDTIRGLRKLKNSSLAKIDDGQIRFERAFIKLELNMKSRYDLMKMQEVKRREKVSHKIYSIAEKGGGFFSGLRKRLRYATAH